MTIKEGQILIGSLFQEPMRVETFRPCGTDTWIIGLVRTKSERFRSVTLTRKDLEALKILVAVTLTGNADQIEVEIKELRQLAQQAGVVEESGLEAKLTRLKELLHKEGFFANPDQRLLIFTEFKDTLGYLVGRFKDWKC